MPPVLVDLLWEWLTAVAVWVGSLGALGAYLWVVHGWWLGTPRVVRIPDELPPEVEAWFGPVAETQPIPGQRGQS